MMANPAKAETHQKQTKACSSQTKASYSGDIAVHLRHWLKREAMRQPFCAPAKMTDDLYFTSPLSISQEEFESPTVEMEMGEGNAKRSLFVNGALLRKYAYFNSSVLHEFKEGAERRIAFKECDVETGTRLLQYLYTLDYDTPMPLPIQNEPSDGKVGNENAQNDGLAAFPGLSNGNDKADSVLSRGATPALDDHKIDRSTNACRFVRWAERNIKASEFLQHFEALQAHAKLYVFADYLGIPDLQRLASNRLRLHVVFIGLGNITEGISNDIAEVAKYIYDHTKDHEAGHLQEEERLRKYISIFISTHFERFSGETFADITSSGGDLTRDLMRKIRDYSQELRLQNERFKTEQLKRKADEPVATPASAPKRKKNTPKSTGM